VSEADIGSKEAVERTGNRRRLRHGYEFGRLVCFRETDDETHAENREKNCP